MALVVGNAFPEAAAEHIHSRGLAFKPTAEYLEKLKAAGASAVILDAVTKSSVGMRQAGKPAADDGAPDCMLQAAAAIRTRDFAAARRALTAIANAGAHHPAVLFVMAELFAREKAWARAAAVYSGLLSIDPGFPEAHTKLAYASYRTDSIEEAIAEAKAALVETPRNAEAHKNLALALQSDGQTEAAAAEFQRALSLKPDYAGAHYDLGLLYEETLANDSAAAEFRKALELDASQPEYHHHLGNALSSRKEFATAAAEYREAKRLDPQLVSTRSDLAAALRNAGQTDAAVAEYRELQSMMPSSTFCHTCYGSLLYDRGDLSAATAEFHEAQRLDATDAAAHLGLAAILDAQHNDEEALREYLVAEQLDPDSGDVHRRIAQFYLRKRQLQDAIGEFKDAVSALPNDERLHYELAEALASTGDNGAAATEYAEVVRLQPRSREAAIKLGALLEKQGKFQSALEEYRRLADAVPNENTRALYQQAETRLRQHHTLPIQPTAQPPQVAESGDGNNSELLWRTSIDAVKGQVRKGNLQLAEQHARQAVEFAEHVNPHDRRLTESLRLLGSICQRKNQFSQAREEYLRALAVAGEISSAESDDNLLTLDELAELAMLLRDYRSAEKYYGDATEIARKLYGPGAGRDEQIFYLANASRQQGDMAKAESLLQELVATNNARDPEGESRLTTYVETLADLYFVQDQYEKAEAFYRRTLALQERQFSARSPMLDRTLYQLAQVMHKLGRPREERAFLLRRSAILTASNLR